MRIDPRRLHVLLTVGREGGIVAAADVLGVSASAVSQQIARLEEEVGLAVVERAPSGAVLTPAGRILAQAGEHIDTELAETAHALRGFTGQVTGTLTIGSFETLTSAVLIPFRRHLVTLLPGIDLRLVETEEKQGMTRLRAGELDALAIERDLVRESAPRGYSDVSLYQEPWLLVTPAALGPITAEQELGSLTWLTITPGTTAAHAMTRITAGIPEPVFSPHEYLNYGVGLSMVRAGLGATIMPQLALAGRDTGGVRTSPLPGLGVRHLLLRHRRNALADQGSAHSQVVNQLLGWIDDNRGSIASLGEADPSGAATGG